MKDDEFRFQAGGVAAIALAVIDLWFATMRLADEILHVLDQWDCCEFISGSVWRFRFCQYAHNRE